MADLLLATKLYIPPMHPNLVNRPRLLSMLGDDLRLGRRLTLISAPAGYGKTTLVGEWLHREKLPAAWLSLDEGDNDIVRFLAYLMAALQKVRPEIGRSAQNLLQSVRPIEEILTSLVNDLAGTHAPLVIVLDDYHTLSTQAVHDSVAFLIEHSPPQVHLVIASRADPPLPLPRLRGRGQVTEIRLNDLRFTTQEAEMFLESLGGLELTDEQAFALHERTEGWAAGLQMASLALQALTSQKERLDISGFIRAFTGSHRFILDYLVEEVLQCQPAYLQTFLLRTSILGHLCGALCAALLQEDNTQAHLPQTAASILENLERANLFIVPLDDQRQWYRYHRLFSDLLNQRLRQLHPEQVPSLHRAASEWLEQNGFTDEAIEHALAAEDHGRAGRLIEASVEAMLMRSEVMTVTRWLDQLPAEEIRSRPMLGIYHAWTLMWRGEAVQVIEDYLDTLSKGVDSHSKIAPLQALLSLYKGQWAEAAYLSRQALEHLPATDPILRNLAAAMQASTMLAEGNDAAGMPALEETARKSLQSGNVLIAGLVLYNLAEYHQKLGDLHQAEANYRRVLELAKDAHGKRLPVASRSLIGLGNLARERNDLEAAENFLQEASELSERWGSTSKFSVYLLSAQIREAQGDFSGAITILKKARVIAEKTALTEMDDYVADLHQARIHLRQGELDFLRNWACQRGLQGEVAEITSEVVENFISSRLRKYEYPILARLWMAEGRLDETLELLRYQVDLTEKMKRRILQLEAEILLAQVHQAKGQSAQAFSILEKALNFAETQNFVRIFVDEGEPIRSLLLEARKRIEKTNPTRLGYIDHLLAAFPLMDTGATQKVKAVSHQTEMAEPLSEREMEVLRLLQSSLSSNEIADELYVSVNTIRSHMKSIYGKLGAHSRYEAIARAKELKLF